MYNMNPFTLTVDFPDGTPSVNKSYGGGANQTVEALSKAIKYYTDSNTPCTISMRDHRGCLVIKEQVTKKRRPRKGDRLSQ